MFHQQYDSTVSKVRYARSLVHLRYSNRRTPFRLQRNTSLSEKDNFFWHRTGKGWTASIYHFLAWPSFTFHGNGTLAEQKSYGFQKEGNFYCLKASCVNDGYENKLFLSVQNRSHLIDMSCSCNASKHSKVYALAQVKVPGSKNQKSAHRSDQWQILNYPSNKLTLNIYQNLISTDVQFKAKHVPSTPAAILKQWYQINTTANTLWVQNGTASIPKGCHTWQTDLLREEKNGYLHSAWLKCLISNYKLAYKFLAKTFQQY